MQERTLRRLSLRTLSFVSMIVLGVVVLGLGAGVVATASRVWHSSKEVERSIWAISVAEELDRTLREYQRLGYVWAATREPAVNEARKMLEADAGRLLREMGAHVATSSQAQRHRVLAEAVEAHFAERRELEVRSVPLDESVRSSRASFERALELGADLRRSSWEELGQTKREAGRALRVHYVLAIAATVVLLVGMVLFTLGMRRLVLAPVLTLERAIRRFREGDPDARAAELAPLELANLSTSFNEMADTIAQQRREQLTFLAAVAHDLRNPLSALKMLVVAIHQGGAGATPELVPRLDRQLDRLTRMVDDLLDATRIEAGHLELQPEDFDLRECARSMSELYAMTTTTHELTLTTAKDPVMIRADPLRVEQVISNLLSNAIKYSPGGGPIEAAVEASPPWAIVAVRDRGRGIPADELPHVFHPFRRRPAAPDSIPGVGLGLSIVQRIVKAHGGHIEIDSQPGVGSTFRVSLPLAPR